jgi:hypothetical protein
MSLMQIDVQGADPCEFYPAYVETPTTPRLAFKSAEEDSDADLPDPDTLQFGAQIEGGKLRLLAGPDSAVSKLDMLRWAPINSTERVLMCVVSNRDRLHENTFAPAVAIQVGSFFDRTSTVQAVCARLNIPAEAVVGIDTESGPGTDFFAGLADVRLSDRDGPKSHPLHQQTIVIADKWVDRTSVLVSPHVTLASRLATALPDSGNPLTRELLEKCIKACLLEGGLRLSYIP